MIERNRDFNLFEVTCDRCSSGSAEFDCDYGWQAMIDELKEAGWRITRDDDGEWTHACPGCAEANDIETITEDFPS